ncbi:MAG: hypothetical protein ABEK59_08580 [Halobacteria archaeon]
MTRIYNNLRENAERFHKLLFRDRLGLLIFLLSLFFSFFIWRIHVNFSDNYTVANTLIGVMDGHLYIDDTVYGDSRGYPGSFVHDNKIYGRNYAQIITAVPFVVLLKLASYIADLRILISALWSLILLGITVQLSYIFDRKKSILYAGSIIGLLLFFANITNSLELNSKWTAFMGLQLSTMVIAGFTGVTLYRIISDIYDKKLGFVAGFGLVLGTPVGFWSVIPKRHSLSALFSILVVYFFYLSRSKDRNKAVRYRVLSYGTVGLFAWLHAPEAFTLFIVLIVFDLVTADRNNPKTLFVIFGGFIISLTPFFYTNYLITGNFLYPPRFVDQILGAVDLENVDLKNKPTPETQNKRQFENPSVLPSFTGKISVYTDLIYNGLLTSIKKPEKYLNVFFRSGRIGGVSYSLQGQKIRSLTVLESVPVFGTLFASAPVFINHIKMKDGIDISNSKTQTDLFVLTYFVLFLLLYIHRIPIQASINGRYLVPVYPLLLYLVFRLPITSFIFSTRKESFYGERMFGTYLVTVFVISQILILYLTSIITPRFSEAVQFNAVLNLAVASTLGVWAVLASIGYLRKAWIGQVLFGLSFGFGTIFTVFYRVVYGPPGWLAIPVVRVLGELLNNVVQV